ncbi:MAG: hypothetical protein WA705_05850 [Candidatus Ozemobacteraceae bacterium]
MPVYYETDAASSRALREALPASFLILGEFPRDPAILEAGFVGRPLPGGNPAAATVLEKIEGILAG